MPASAGAPGDGQLDRARAEGDRHLALARQQAGEGQLAEHVVHGLLEAAQHRADRAVARVEAVALDAGVAVAEAGVEQPPAEGREHVERAHLRRRTRERVAAVLPARARSRARRGAGCA